ncbi:MAG: HEAT repeat domain-containing protein [Archangium sp.]
MTEQHTPREKALIALERETNLAVRLEAATTLCELAFDATSDERAFFVPDVVQLLSDKQDEVRCAGLALASAVLPPNESKEILTRHLSDPVVRVRVEAAGRLADLELPEARGALAAALQDKAPGVRFEAARGIAELQHSAGIDVLIAGLDDGEFRYRAAGALARLGDKAAIEPLKKTLNGWFVPQFDKTQIAGALAVLGDAEGVAHLEKRIEKKSALDRPMAVEFLGELDSPTAKQKLISIVNTVDDTARGTAARAIGHHGGADVVTLLTSLLTAGSDDFKLDVAEGLLRAGARDVVEKLTLTDAEAQKELVSMLADYGVSK